MDVSWEELALDNKCFHTTVRIIRNRQVSNSKTDDWVLSIDGKSTYEVMILHQ